MHQALLITELLSNIFSYVAHLDQEEDTRRTLYSLTHTCRAFYEPARDALWTRLDDIAPLVKCMPPEVWEERRCNISRSVSLELLREPTKEDWVQFARNARLVRELSFFESRRYDYRKHRYITYEVSWDILSAVSRYACSRVGPLFRNLRVLHCHCYDYPHGTFAGVAHFGGTTLKKLHIDDKQCYPGASPEAIVPLHAVLASFGVSTPRLEDLAVFSTTHSFHSHVIPSTAGFSEMLVGQDRLKHFASRIEMGESQVACLAGLVHMKSLSVKLAPDFPAEATCIPLQVSGNGFKSLENLDIEASEIGACISFLTLASSCTPLRTLRVSFGLCHLTSSTIHKLFLALQSFVLLDCLVINIGPSLSGLLPPQGSRIYLPMSTLSQLFTLRLRTFVFETSLVDIETDLHDHGIGELARAWPGLEKLVIGQRGQIGTAPACITPVGLKTLSSECTSLRELGIALDFSGITSSSRLPTNQDESHAQHALRKLTLYPPSPSIENSVEVAKFLHSIYPDLKKVEEGAKGGFFKWEMGDGWKDVARRLELSKDGQFGEFCDRRSQMLRARATSAQGW